MAPSTSSDDQFTFLISCIRHSDGGKVNFQKVAEECSIVSKGAAAKRYERMMKSHGIHQSQTSANNDTPASDTNASTPKARASKKAACTDGTPSKKRKLKQEIATEDAAEDHTSADHGIKIEASDSPGSEI